MGRLTLQLDGGSGHTAVVRAAAPPLALDIDTLFDRHYRDVYRYVLALTRSHADADDITAEAFERALRAPVGSPGTELEFAL